MAPRESTLLTRWPEHLVERVTSRNFVLVLGAGTSRSCTNASGRTPPSWADLLLSLADSFTKTKARAAAKDLVERMNYLEAAELIRVCARTEGKEQDFLGKIAEMADGGRESQYRPVELHDALMRLEPDIIVTTNYDRVIERATNNGYNLHRFDSTTLASDVRSGNPVLLKIHGSVDSATELVLTRSDYARLRRDGAHALEVLQALFLTKTALFAGYSLNDPDIQLLLENALGARGNTPAHYLLTGGPIPSHVQQMYSYCYGTTTVHYKSGDYAEMKRMIEVLGDEVGALRPSVA